MSAHAEEYASERNPHLWIECTNTFVTGGNTGIQRVVRCVVNHLPSPQKAADWVCVPVRYDPVMESFFPVPSIVKSECEKTKNEPQGLKRKVKTFVRGVLGKFHCLDFAAKIKNLALQHGYYRPRRLLGTLKSKGRAGMKRVLSRIGLWDRLKQFKHSVFPLPASSVRALDNNYRELSKGDVLVMLDSCWNLPIWNKVQELKRRGVFVVAVVYDTLPLEMPENFPDALKIPYTKWWHSAKHDIDAYICISESVWKGVAHRLAFCEDQVGRPWKLTQDLIGVTQRDEIESGTLDPTKLVNGGFFRLGAELDGYDDRPDVRQRVKDAFSTQDDTPTYLMVGTLEPRKGHVVALKAFEKLWKEKTQVRLVLVGKLGWNVDELSDQLYRLIDQGHELFWFNDLGDAELTYCYQKADALITASKGEGFNLPIVEALFRGTTVFASDLPIHREVGGAFAHYFPSENSDALAETIQQHSEAKEISVSSPRDFKWPNWQESSEELIRAVDQCLANRMAFIKTNTQAELPKAA
ncbi:Hypothetical protein PBC10988_39420 [Planctomycetales bacterium 10988]|nr:Hypothetical protein PBC10988_39420 [Planctomycetales bacterium 10988]